MTEQGPNHTFLHHSLRTQHCFTPAVQCRAACCPPWVAPRPHCIFTLPLQYVVLIAPYLTLPHNRIACPLFAPCMLKAAGSNNSSAMADPPSTKAHSLYSNWRKQGRNRAGWGVAFQGAEALRGEALLSSVNHSSTVCCAQGEGSIDCLCPPTVSPTVPDK